MIWSERRTRRGYEIKLTDRHPLTGERLTIVQVVPFGMKRTERYNYKWLTKKHMLLSLEQAQKVWH